jgi:hypothetical protein
VHREHETPDSNIANRHDRREPQDALALQFPPYVDGGNDEPRVREDKRLPGQVERHLLGTSQTADDGDCQPPESKRPDENCREGRHDVQHFLSGLVVPKVAYVFWYSACHADQGQSRECRRTDRDEHPRPEIRCGKSVLEEAPPIYCVHMRM